MVLRRLRKGDTIGVFTPSAPATVTAEKRFTRAKAFLEGKGFHIKDGSRTGKQESYRSGTPKERAEELNELLRDPEVTMIMPRMIISRAISWRSRTFLTPFQCPPTGRMNR